MGFVWCRLIDLRGIKRKGKLRELSPFLPRRMVGRSNGCYRYGEMEINEFDKLQNYETQNSTENDYE